MSLAFEHRAARRRPSARKAKVRRRKCAPRVELLEARTVLTALPYGAMPDDTGEYMLGDVYVTVVRMESNNSIDNGTITYPPGQPITYTPENWSNWSAGEVQQLRTKIEDGVNVWKQTLDAMPIVRDGLLNFTFDWTHFNTPIATGYEPIARRSNDFQLWMYDFLNHVGFSSTLNFSSDIRAYNNFQRQEHNADWAFTMFVVDNKMDAATDDGNFAVGGTFPRAFSFAGGRFEIIPAGRPIETYAHETGHMFWALDEYSGGGSHSQTRGYYNTQNTNAFDNPEQGFQQQPSLMMNLQLLEQAFSSRITSQSSAEMIGWRDKDGDGIFDVLDVPFTLTGSGRFDVEASSYRFIGSSEVNTLPNANPAGLQNDITINQIREVQFSIDGGAWQTAQTLPNRTYKTNLDVSVSMSAGSTIKIRTIDTRTGAMSPEFIGNTSLPDSTTSSGASGFVYFDADADGSWDATEGPLVDWAVDLVDQFGTPIDPLRRIEPNDYVEGTVLNGVHPEAILSAIGGDIGVNEVQELSFGGTSGGTATPAYDGVNGLPLTYVPGVSPSATEVQNSLNAIPALAGNILVSGPLGGPFTVTFTGSLSLTNVSLISQGNSTGGTTLSASAIRDGASNTVFARSSEIFAGAGKTFWHTSQSLGGFSEKWTSTSRRLRVDFAAPVSTVSIRALAAGAGNSFGRLEAFDSTGRLIARFTTTVTGLTSGQSEVMTVSRPVPDIAYVIARAHLGSEIGLDTLTWGPRGSATTNTQGAWWMPYLGGGSYRVKVTAPGGHVVTTPPGGIYNVSFNPGESVGHLDFGIAYLENIWHNLAFPENVDNDTRPVANILDVLMLVNWLTLNPGATSLPESGDPNVIGYIDVNNDRICNIIDVLALVNYITLHPIGGGGGGGGFAGGGGGFAGGGDSGGGEGEALAESSSAPASAADYYATYPIHFLEIPGTDLPCCCNQCLAVEAVTPALAAVAESNGADPQWLPDLDGEDPTKLAPITDHDSKDEQVLTARRRDEIAVDSALAPVSDSSARRAKRGRLAHASDDSRSVENDDQPQIERRIARLRRGR